MKKFNVEKSTLKWIFIWFSICFLFWIVVLAGEFTDTFHSSKNENKLTDWMWNGVMARLDGIKEEVFSDVKNYMIPSQTIIMFAGNECPKYWHKWTYDDWAVRFITPLKEGENQNFRTWWSWEFTILEKNMPKHSHYVVWGQWTATLGQENALSSQNYGSNNLWDADYKMAWVWWVANKWKTNEVWWWEPVSFTPQYIKILFCIKD